MDCYFSNCNYPWIYHVRFVADEVEPVSPCCLLRAKTVAIVQIGSQPARFAALTSGKVQGAMVAIPVTAKAKKMGFNELADLQMLGLEYPKTGLRSPRD